VGKRTFNRISAPDANSCASCHNAPYGIVGGGGDFVTNVFLLGQRFDFMSFNASETLPTHGAVDETGKPATLQTAADLRSTTGMFGAGDLEMLARQRTESFSARDRIGCSQADATNLRRCGPSMTGSASEEFSGVGDVAMADRSNLRRLHRDDRSGLAVERRELDLERVAVLIGVNHRSDVSRLQAFLWDGRRQHHAVEFLDHRRSSLLTRIRSYQTRGILSAFDDPDGSENILSRAAGRA
jgi:hypothetical protein